MDLAKARAHVLAHHDAGALQGGLCGLRLPAVRSQMIATEQHALARQADLIGHTPHDIAESRRPQSGVAAVLVHLIGGRLDECLPAEDVCVLQGGAQHQRMRRADRIDAHWFAPAVTPQQLEQGSHARSSGSMASSAAAAKASTMPASFSGCGTMPSSSNAMSAVMSGAPALVSGETTRALP